MDKGIIENNLHDIVDNFNEKQNQMKTFIQCYLKKFIHFMIEIKNCKNAFYKLTKHFEFSVEFDTSKNINTIYYY